MYQRWLKHGDAVFEGPSSPVIAEALNTGRGPRGVASSCRIPIVISPPWLTDGVRSAETVEQGVEKGAARGDTRVRTPLTPVLNPLADRR